MPLPRFRVRALAPRPRSFRWWPALAVTLFGMACTGGSTVAPANADDGQKDVQAEPTSLTLRIESAHEPAEPETARHGRSSRASAPNASPASFAIEPAISRHEIRVDGRRIRYTATAQTLELRDEAGKPTAEVFHVSYLRDDVDDASTRPVTFVFNGGPGSSATWLHLGLLGPRRVVLDDAQPASPPPHEIVDNPFGLIDVSDLVFIDPVGTGLSRATSASARQLHWGVNEDLNSVGEFIRLWITENGRWNSPKFLAGESYGTTRAAGLVGHLHRHGMSLNGVILISAVLDFQTLAFQPGNDRAYVGFLPSYAAAAAHHGVVKSGEDFELFMHEVRRFAQGDYARSLAAGSTLSPAERHATIAAIAKYTGLDPDYIDRSDLRITQPRFCKQLLRSRRQTIGRFDARYVGSDSDAAGERTEHDPSYDAIVAPYTAAINHYLRAELGLRETREYRVLHGPVSAAWKWPANGRSGFTNVADDLGAAMRENPHLQVFVANGYQDLATPFFATEWTLHQLRIPKASRANLHVKYYPAGHMMYLHPESLMSLSTDLHQMIAKSTAR